MSDSPDPMELLPDEWRPVLEREGERAFRAGQVFRWIHRRGVLDPEAMSDLGRALRARLAALGVREPGSVQQVRCSADGTRKLLIELADGARVECVLIPMGPGSDPWSSDADGEGDATGENAAEPSRRRVTLCLSTQQGCKMRCVFCASGRAGFRRDLGAAEVVYQVLAARRHLKADEDLHNLVFMGMGEPLDCYEQTARAIRLLTHPDGGGVSPRRITVSTVGLVDGIARLGRDFAGKVGLAVSLHASDDATRFRLVPGSRRTPLRRLIQALHDYPLPRRRRITIEYTLVDGVNDSPEQARALAGLLHGLRVKINLIPMNPIAGSPLRAPLLRRVEAFREELATQGYGCFLRTRRGHDVAAACGQLALAERVAG